MASQLYSSAPNGTEVTPCEALYGKKASVSDMRIFGSPTYVHVRKRKRDGKFLERSKKGLLVGYDERNSYLFSCQQTRPVLLSRDLKLVENQESSQLPNTVSIVDQVLIDVEYCWLVLLPPVDGRKRNSVKL